MTTPCAQCGNEKEQMIIVEDTVDGDLHVCRDCHMFLLDPESEHNKETYEYTMDNYIYEDKSDE